MGADETKATTDSAGMVTPLFPVNTAPAVPAPAPTRPPIKAPLPPPAIPPIKCAPTSPAADHRARSLALSFHGLFIFLGGYSVSTDAVELNPKVTLPFESALFSRGDHGAADRSASFQYDYSLDTDRLRERSTKRVADVTGF